MSTTVKNKIIENYLDLCIKKHSKNDSESSQAITKVCGFLKAELFFINTIELTEEEKLLVKQK